MYIVNETCEENIIYMTTSKINQNTNLKTYFKDRLYLGI